MHQKVTWEKIRSIFGNEKADNISKEYKKLYFKMVAYEPNERPSIDDILNNDWIKNIKI